MKHPFWERVGRLASTGLGRVVSVWAYPQKAVRPQLPPGPPKKEDGFYAVEAGKGITRLLRKPKQ